MCFRVMFCYMSRNAPVLMGLGISTPCPCLSLIAVQKAGVPPSCDLGRIGPVSVPKHVPTVGLHPVQLQVCLVIQREEDDSSPTCSVS